MNKIEVPPAEHTVEMAKEEPKLWQPDSVKQRRGLQAVVKLAALNGTGKYILGGGGKNPASKTPHTWVGGVYGSDCIGAVCWGLGTPRFNEAFPEYGGWINCDSAMMDAALIPGGKGLGRFFRYVPREKVYPGCICIYRSIRRAEIPELAKGGKASDRVRIGHVGLVAGWDGLVDPSAAFVEAPEGTAKWDGKLASLVTVECCSSTPAIRMRRNVNFTDARASFVKGAIKHTQEEWGVRFLEYVGP